jgi:hypothetical protein
MTVKNQVVVFIDRTGPMVLNSPVRPAHTAAPPHPTALLTVSIMIMAASVQVAGCAASLLPDISRAQDAITLAKEAKAELYASELLRDAQASLNEALPLVDGQRRDAQELLLRARIQAEVAAALAKERAVAEQLQSARERRDAAKAAATAAQETAQAAKEELGR